MEVEKVIPKREVAELKPWENEIIELWRTGPPGQPWRWSYSAVSPKSAWIKGYLTEKGEAFVRQLWLNWKDFVEKAQAYGVKIKVGSYQTMKQHVWLLKRLRLIVPVRKEQTLRKSHIPRTYYSLNPDMIDAPYWNRPLQTLYPTSDWKKIPAERKGEIRRKMKEKRRRKV